MKRLIVGIVSGERASGVTQWASGITLLVSVSRSDDGLPVTGLTEGNFRIAWSKGSSEDATVAGPFRELSLEPGDTEPAGVYVLSITHQNPVVDGSVNIYAVQVRVNQEDEQWQGQGIVRVVARTI